MQDDPRYDDVVGEVEAFLAERAEAAVAAGIARERIALDPGIGFGKTLAHNLALLRALPRLARARPAAARRLAQALPRHAHAAARSPRTAWPPPSPLRSTATAAAPISCACTTCAPRPMPSPSSEPWRAPDADSAAHDRGARARGARPSRRARARARERAALPARPRAGAALVARPARPTASPTPSPTATPRASRSSSPRATRFDLIERLAAHIADALLARMPLERATVTVHKPDAPLGLEFDDVAVTVTRVRVPSVVANEVTQSALIVHARQTSSPLSGG